MPTPRVIILRAPGTNCDAETVFAFEQAGAIAERVHVERLRESPGVLADYQVLCIPGGFSYGDDIAAGRIFATQIGHHLQGGLEEFKAAGKLILGICNGFQVLLKSGLLLPVENGKPQATLDWNDSGKFEDRWVELRVTSDGCVFLRGIESLYLPVAHAEGKFVTRDPQTLARLDAQGQLVLRYSLGDHTTDVPYPANPNGSPANVAGVSDTTGLVFGLMPHPERHIDPTHHPRWTRGESGGNGLRIFENAVGYFG